MYLKNACECTYVPSLLIFQYTASENQIHLQCEEVKASTKRNGKYYFIGFIQKLI